VDRFADSLTKALVTPYPRIPISLSHDASGTIVKQRVKLHALTPEFITTNNTTNNEIAA